VLDTAVRDDAQYSSMARHLLGEGAACVRHAAGRGRAARC
jgi:hypothetical protein